MKKAKISLTLNMSPNQKKSAKDSPKRWNSYSKFNFKLSETKNQTQKQP